VKKGVEHLLHGTDPSNLLVYVSVRLLLKRFAQQYSRRLQATGASIFISVAVLAAYLVVQISNARSGRITALDDDESADDVGIRLEELLGFICYIAANLLVLGGLLICMVIQGDKANACWAATKPSLRQWQLELRAGCCRVPDKSVVAADVGSASHSAGERGERGERGETDQQGGGADGGRREDGASGGGGSEANRGNDGGGRGGGYSTGGSSKERKAMCHMIDAAIAVLDFDDEQAPLKLFGVRASTAVVGGAIGSVLAVVSSALVKAALR
jgi:hypothetical protein